MVRARLSVLLAPLALLALSACPEEGSVPYQYLRPSWSEAACAQLAGCGVYNDADYCIDDFKVAYPDDPDLDAAVANGTVIYDGEAAQACIDRVDDAACGDLLDKDLWEMCEAILRPTIPVGDACWISEQCIDGACEKGECTEACCVGTCVATPPDAAIGEDCSGGRDCAEGYCDLTTDRCAAYKAAGAACSFNAECGGLYCLGGACQEGVAEGSPCLDGACGPPWLGCDVDSDTCQRLRGEGEPCNPLVNICARGLLCLEASPVCTPPGGAGSPCSYTVFGHGCTSDTFCETAFGTEGTCQPLKAAGSACVVGSECATRYCGAEKVCATEPVCVQ